MHVADAVAAIEFGADAIPQVDFEYDHVTPAQDIRTVLARYAAEARKFPLLSHSAFVEHSRAVYRHHYDRLTALMSLPSTIGQLVALNRRRQRGQIRYTSFVCSVGDQTLEAKDRVFAEGRRTNLPIPPAGYPDTSISREEDDVHQALDDLQLLYEAFADLPAEIRASLPETQAQPFVQQALRLEVRWDALESMINHFRTATDEFASAKRRVIAAAALQAPAADIDQCVASVSLDHPRLASQLVSYFGASVTPAEIKRLIAEPLHAVRGLEAEHLIRCEQALALRRDYDRANRAMREAINEIVVRNLLLVVKEVSRSDMSGETVLDAIQEGNDGLAEAAMRFKYWTGTRFSTYAAFWITQRLQRLRTSTRSVFAIPIGICHDFAEVNRTRYRLARANGGRLPTVYEIAVAMNVDVAKVVRAEAAYASHESDDLLDLLPSEEDEHADAVAHEQMVAVVTAVLDSLPRRHADIVRMYFGLNGPSLTLKEIATRCGLSAERVRRMYREAIKRLATGDHAEQLKPFLA